MTDLDPQPAARQPFAEAPRRPVAPSGCGKPLLVGCGVLVLLGAVALVVMVAKAPELLAWALEQSRTGIFERLPEDLTEQEVARLDAALDAAVAALRNERIDPEGLRELQDALLTISGRGGRLDREDVLRLIGALERVGGVGGEALDDEPSGPHLEGGLTAA